ncbi:MAG: hypothetical protein GWN84_23875 [Gammaproteobacteria bacterium]|nr:hypothetical protein [Gammaproteobacteria bacterium]NIR85621.1 hypothetical protein [Gammaproteobacteria bacterium]NIR90109.1 hypothetical protein [Gammaproteobacteria bacterium]NIU06755.1 hypothetical protein [Gammaproteobacteria bacterium]NIV53688.1 hypothetical protein [Gammaproteobacteria bacterium]
MYVFVIRPFGTKSGIDFDRVHAELIEPAMAKLSLRGGTTEPIARAGNIRADMFELLAKADIVIADMSIHNANVFYELGVRHALRDKRTFLIRSRSDEVPFDLRTDRYLEYGKDNPGECVDRLVEGLRQTIDTSITDSPIFALVPKLEPQDWTRLVAVPEEFTEEVRLATDKKQTGDLELLSLEAQEFEWASEGLRLVGRSQFDLRSWEGASETWQTVRDRLGGDLEADLKLATIFQRLGELERSNIAVDRALADPGIDNWSAAEAYALKGSNEKSRWMKDWGNVPAAERPERALASGYLRRSRKFYAKGFASDLNHYYSGINALALQVIVSELARSHADVWGIDFDTDEDAERALGKIDKERRELEGAVALSVYRQVSLLESKGERDRWADITKADLALLTEKRAKRVARAYRRALQGAEVFYFDAVRRQLSIYQQLGVLTETVGEVLVELDTLENRAGVSRREPREQVASEHVLLFTGHRIDHPDRPTPRFPPDKESVARDAIREAIVKEQERVTGKLTGMAGGASGGDILFHEVCQELGIDTRLYLAIPSKDYIVESVYVPGQPEWIDRFQAIEDRCSSRTLSRTKELPGWLKGRKDYSIWQRNNLWMLHNALAFGGKHVTLIALWNGEAGDGPGGTEDMVSQAKARGAKTVILDTKALFKG